MKFVNIIILSISLFAVLNFCCSEESNNENNNITENEDIIIDTASVKYSTVTVMVPEDSNTYDSIMNYLIDFGIKELPETIVFKEKTIQIPYTEDKLRASIDAAAKELNKVVKVVYFKVSEGTAYFALNVEYDGWTGVSYTIAKTFPIIEQTLLQFEEIDNVENRFAPEDQENKRREFLLDSIHNLD